MTIDKQKLKNIRVNKSSADINCYSKKNKKSVIINNKKNIEIKNNNKNNDDNKIEKLKNRIFDLMNVIDNFEKDYINSNKPLQIKEQLNKINFKIMPHNIQQNKNNKNKANDINDINEHLYITERNNYNKNNVLNNNKKNYFLLNEDFDICNYYDYDYDNKILTKRVDSNKKKGRAVSSKFSDNSKPIIMLNYKQNNNKNNNNASNSTFMKLISSNSSSKNELNNTNYNMGKNKGKILINQIISNANKTVNKNKKDKSQKEKESSIFKRRINYSNFINQKMKQNIIHRNQELLLKQSKINKSRYSYNNSNNSNGRNQNIAMNNNYYNGNLKKENNNKSNSLEKNVIKLNDLNNIINKGEKNNNKIKNKNKNRNRNNNKNEFYNNFFDNEYSKNYFLSENRDNNDINSKRLDN